MTKRSKTLGPRDIASIAMAIEEYMSSRDGKAATDRERVTRLVVELYLSGMTDRTEILAALKRSEK